MVRVSIFWQRFCLFSPLPFYHFIHQPGQLRLRPGCHALLAARHKARAHNCAVFILNIAIAHQMAHPVKDLRSCKAGQAWRKEKKRDFPVQIKRADLRQDRKRRVVQHHSALRVVVVLIIAAGVKRAHNFGGVNAVLLAGPVPNHGIHAGRCIAVIRGLFGLEFFHEFLIGLTFRHMVLLLTPASHAFCSFSCPGPAGHPAVPSLSGSAAG